MAPGVIFGRQLAAGRGDRGGDRKQDVIGDLGEGRAGAGFDIGPGVLEVERGAVVDQPELAVPDQQVRVARGAVDVGGQGIEPDDAGGEVGVDEVLHGDGVGQGAGQEIEREVEPAAGREEVLDLGIGLGLGEDGIELGEDDLGHRQAEEAADLAGDQLGDQGADTLARRRGT